MGPRTILLTGASSGIGEALALEWGARGAHLALLARRAGELDAVAAKVRARGGRALTIPCDVADPRAVIDAVQRADAELGSLDMVVANAGVASTGHASTAKWEDVARVIDVNLRGAMATLTAAIPVMLAAQRGHLVGVSSLAGKRALPMSSAYCASKAALSTFLEGLRLDLAPSGIRVTDVQPGFVETPMIADSHHPKPFVWTSDHAARVIANRLARAPAVLSFPWPLALLTSLSRHLPRWIYEPVVRATS